MALVASLIAGMGLVAVIATFHPGTVRSGRNCIVGNIAVAIDTENIFFPMKLVRDFYNADALQICLLSPGNRGMAADTLAVHEIMAGRKLARENPPNRDRGMAIGTGNRFRVGP